MAHGRIVPLEGNSASLGAIRVPGGAGPLAQLGGADWDVVSPGYFAVVGLGLLEGRAFTAADRDGQRRVAIVNEAFARAAWPNRSPVGQQFWRVTDEHAPALARRPIRAQGRHTTAWVSRSKLSAWPATRSIAR